MEFGKQQRFGENDEVVNNNNNNNNNNDDMMTAPVAPRHVYRECMKNHAPLLAGYAVDGCGEFMPAGPEGSIDALKCAACACHRNFHRKVDPRDMYQPPAPILYHPPPPPPPAHVVYNPSVNQPQPLALPAPGGARGSLSKGTEEHAVLSSPNAGANGASGTRKRFRTKFTQEQRNGMFAMAESIGWRLRRRHEDRLQQFCQQAQVKRSVFKVWMHNHKGERNNINGNNSSSSSGQQQQPPEN